MKAKLLDGKKGLIVGIANDRSIAWGCARAFRALGAELAITYLNDKAKPHVEPLAREVDFMAIDVMQAGQLEAMSTASRRTGASSTSSSTRSPSRPRTPSAAA